MFKRALVVLSLVTLAACGQRERGQQAPQIIGVNIVDALEVHFAKESGILLDHIFPGTVDDAIIVDSTLLVLSANRLDGFSLRSGKKKTAFSTPGRGPGEYVRIWDYGVDGKDIYLYDIDGKRMLFFTPEGGLLRTIQLSEKSADNPFQSVIPVPWENAYLGKRVFGMPDVPELSLYDKDFRFVRAEGTDILRSGIKLWRQLFIGADGDILYNRYFSNAVQSITQDGVFVKYLIDFSGLNLGEVKDEYEILGTLSKPENAGRYAGIMGSLFENEYFFAFQFATGGNKYLAVFDKLAKNSKLFLPVVERCEVRQVFLHGESLFIIAADEDNNIFFYRHPHSLQ